MQELLSQNIINGLAAIIFLTTFLIVAAAGCTRW